MTLYNMPDFFRIFSLHVDRIFFNKLEIIISLVATLLPHDNDNQRCCLLNECQKNFLLQ